jgi:hypothetical protein
MARKRVRERMGMSVYPPAEVAPALGAFKSTEFERGIRLAARMLGEAAEQIAGEFTPAEWEFMARIMTDRRIEPEADEPGAAVAQFVDQAHRLTGAAPEQPAKGGAARSVGDLVGRLRRLTFPQAWAVIIALDFRARNAEEIEEGCRWWEPRGRWPIIERGLEARREKGN